MNLFEFVVNLLTLIMYFIDQIKRYPEWYGTYLILSDMSCQSIRNSGTKTPNFIRMLVNFFERNKTEYKFISPFEVPHLQEITSASCRSGTSQFTSRTRSSVSSRREFLLPSLSHSTNGLRVQTAAAAGDPTEFACTSLTTTRPNPRGPGISKPADEMFFCCEMLDWNTHARHLRPTRVAPSENSKTVESTHNGPRIIYIIAQYQHRTFRPALRWPRLVRFGGHLQQRAQFVRLLATTTTTRARTPL